MNLTYTTVGRPPISEFYVDLFCRSDVDSDFVRLKMSKLKQYYNNCDIFLHYRISFHQLCGALKKRLVSIL